MPNRIVPSLVAAFALLATVFAPVTSRAADPPLVGSLALGETAFWDGGNVGSSPTYSAPLVASVNGLDRCANVGPCSRFRLKVEKPGAILRVGLDTPARDDGFEMIITSPAGVTTRATNGNQYSIETFISNPAAGIWNITVAPYSADNATFRMRAKLEATPYKPKADSKRRLLPNLQVTRLWEFNFTAPANPGNGLFPPDDVNPPLDVLGYHPLSCAADEIAEEGAVRCLRYSFGLANVGHGNFDVRSISNQTDAYAMTQCIQRSSGAPIAHPAGKGAFHKTHGHAHYLDIIFHKLMKVKSLKSGSMTSAGKGKKLGYSPADQGIPHWNSFTNAASGTGGSAGSCVPGSTARLGMSRGWGDAYRYQRPGNYVEFGANGDGYYVVRTTADPLNHVIESDETDNTSYALVRVVGDEVDVIESGVGDSPWDPDKQVFV